MPHVEMNSEVQTCAWRMIRLALEEDLMSVGDLTTEATIPESLSGFVQLVPRVHGVISGLSFARLVFQQLPFSVDVREQASDGDVVTPGQVIATFSGSVRGLLIGERTLLNLLSHLSGIATQTARFVEVVRGTHAAILDTRKTLPGYRLLQKYAVRCGGGCNHRLGLHDGILIKDNHLAARGDISCASAVAAARGFLSGSGRSLPVEIEVDSLDQLREALVERPDIVLLDNMAPPLLREAVALRDQRHPSTLLEASGGITLANVRAVADTGVDRISVGSLTHSSPALDLGFDWPW
jgi:nicotinate-nucleotide pyrophosphorylase (carboxylating)